MYKGHRRPYFLGCSRSSHGKVQVLHQLLHINAFHHFVLPHTEGFVTPSQAPTLPKQKCSRSATKALQLWHKTCSPNPLRHLAMQGFVPYLLSQKNNSLWLSKSNHATYAGKTYCPRASQGAKFGKAATFLYSFKTISGLKPVVLLP